MSPAGVSWFGGIAGRRLRRQPLAATLVERFGVVFGGLDNELAAGHTAFAGENSMMEPAPETDDLRQFFDRQHESRQYESLKSMTSALDEEAAGHLNSLVGGDTLTVGGIWDHFDWPDGLSTLTVLDLSEAMLKTYCPPGAVAVVGNLYEHEFPQASFDHIVFPLMLHHVAQGSWGSCEARIRTALSRAKQWLRPDGRVTVLEYCPHPIWMPVQRVALPLTTRFLSRFGQPLVVMHSRRFYERVLLEQFGPVHSMRIEPVGFNEWKFYPVFMSIRWLRVPLVVYPKLHLFTAVAQSDHS
jgi:hypothetical protein